MDKKTQVEVEEGYNYCPILLQMERNDVEPTNPFKFKHSWLEYKEFQEFV